MDGIHITPEFYGNQFRHIITKLVLPPWPPIQGDKSLNLSQRIGKPPVFFPKIQNVRKSPYVQSPKAMFQNLYVRPG